MISKTLTGNVIRFTLIATIAGVLTSTALADFTIYSDDFSGSGNALHGTTPDIALSLDPFVEDITWNAAQFSIFDDGTVNTDENNPLNPDRGGGGAYLPFEPDAGQIYTASFDITNLTRSWVGFGFVENPNTPFIDDDSGRQEQDGSGIQWFQVNSNNANFRSDKTTQVASDGSFGASGGTFKYEITLDTNDVNNVMVGASRDGTPMDLDPGSAALDYNAGPLVTMGVDGLGIRGVGFSVRGISFGTLVDAVDNFLLVSDGDIPPVLNLEVNTSSGEMTIQGNGSAAENINSYQITSVLGQLDSSEGMWNSLDDQDFPAGLAGDFDENGAVAGADFLKWQTDGLSPAELSTWEDNYGNSGSGASTGWEEGGAVSTSFLGEAMLEGDSTIAAAASISLGTSYTGPAAGDLRFIYRNASGSLVKGDVSYIAAVAAATVPEPSSVALVAVTLLGISTRRRKHR